MVFAIPFLAIPIGGKPDPHNHGVAKPQVDVNVKSLLAMGGILIMLFFIVPKVVHLYFPPNRDLHGSGHQARGTYFFLKKIPNRFSFYLANFNIFFRYSKRY